MSARHKMVTYTAVARTKRGNVVELVETDWLMFTQIARGLVMCGAIIISWRSFDHHTTQTHIRVGSKGLLQCSRM